jgi:hypothetical protein
MPAEIHAEARREMERYCDGKLPPVLDPFLGSSSIPLEADQLGLAAHAAVLNPEAWRGVSRQYVYLTGRKVTVVFDGYAAKHKSDVAETTHGVDVLFSGRGKMADDVVERLVSQAENRGKILVVTSDAMGRHAVES